MTISKEQITHNGSSPQPAIPWLAVGLISAAALGYELLLTRLFSIVHWHHLVGMIISLALLGYGASGTFLTLLGERVRHHFTALFVANALFFAITAGAAVWVIQQLPLNPLELPWDPRQPLYLAAVYLAAALPFLGAANCVGMALAVFPRHSHRVYAVDLLGAGMGVALVTALFWVWHPAALLWPVAGAGIAAAVAAGAAQAVGWVRLLGLALLSAAAVAAILGPLTVESADYKDLPQATAALGARVMSERPGPMGVVTVVANERVPFRHAPGLSLRYPGPPADQQGVFVDGEGAGALTPRVDGTPPDYLRHLVSALPYRMAERPRVLMLGLAGNGPLLQALAHGARHVTAVEPDPGLAALARQATPATDLEVVVTGPRTYAQGAPGRYDLIVTDLGNAGNVGGLQSQASTFRFTTEALAAYLRHLDDDGLLAISGALQLPPRASLKLAATARDALRAAGHSEPAAHIALIRDWQMFTLVVGREPLSAARREAVRTFADDHGFDLVALPGMARDEANRHHQLAEPRYFDGVAGVLGQDPDGFAAAYPFHIAPATDDNPYFFRFSRWSNLPEVLTMPAGTGFAQLDLGYWMSVASLGQALVLGLLLILLPLLVLRRSRTGAGLKARTAAYFTAVGLAFLFVEIAFIQRLQLVLGHPVYATATVLVGFLVWAGLGSYLSRRPLGGRPAVNLRARLAAATLVIAVTALAYLWWLPQLTTALLDWPFGARLVASLLLIGPLALAMGLPFPLGLALVEERSGELLPWAWGINGCASVVSSIAATLLVMEVGFSGLVALALALYLPLPLLFRDKAGSTAS